MLVHRRHSLLVSCIHCGEQTTASASQNRICTFSVYFLTKIFVLLSVFVVLHCKPHSLWRRSNQTILPNHITILLIHPMHHYQVFSLLHCDQKLGHSTSKPYCRPLNGHHSQSFSSSYVSQEARRLF